MIFLLSFFTFNSLNLELFAYNIEPPLKNFRDGSKSAFIQVPYISISRDQKVKEIQEEITNNWPEGIITYYLEDNSYDSSVGVLIRAAMSVLESSACVRFRASKDKPDGNTTWLHITNPKKIRECVHDAEVLESGEIRLVLGYDCLKPKDLLHSLLHGIGFKDEVTHPHRDNYIKVIWDNIQPAYRHLYHTQPVEISRSIVEYDPLSIMHFHDRAFSINGKATVLPLETGLNISPSDSLSQLDKMRLHIYFGHECNKRKFSSLMETCKMSLKGEKEPADDENDDKKSQPDVGESKNAEDNMVNDKDVSKDAKNENDETTNADENMVNDKDVSKDAKNAREDDEEQQVNEDDGLNKETVEENQEDQQNNGEMNDLENVEESKEKRDDNIILKEISGENVEEEQPKKMNAKEKKDSGVDLNYYSHSNSGY